MAGSSSNLDGTSFSGSYGKMERSASFSRSAQLSTEIPPLSQYLNLEPISLLGEQHKYSRSGELRRVLGISVEDHSFGSAQSKAPIAEELKRFKGSLADSSSRARERVKLFQESITNADKYKSVVSKRRQRSEMSSEKSGGSKLNGGQAQSGEISRPEERPKNLVPNKRARSSLAESRSEGRGVGSMRQGSVNNEKQRSGVEKDKNSPGLAGEGWEKKLKRKRSVGSMVSRAANDNNNAGEVTKQRSSATTSTSNPESRPRFNDTNALAFRSGVGGMNKTDSQQSSGSGSGPRAPAKSENDNHPGDRRDRTLPPPKGNNKLGTNARGDEAQSSGGSGAMGKTKASRAPRSNAFVVMNSSPSFSSRLPLSDAWDPPSAPPSNKLSQSPSSSNAAAAPNRKRSASASAAPAAVAGPPSSPSPTPVAQWVGQRPHKIQRTRRAHVVSPVSNFDDATPGPTNEQPSPSPSRSSQQRGGGGGGSGRNNNNNSDMGGGAVASSPVESEESKGKGGAENGESVSVTTITNTSSKKNNSSRGGGGGGGGVVLKEEDGVRRQGRTGRGGGGGGGSAHARSLLSLPKDKDKDKMEQQVTHAIPKPPKTRPADKNNNNDNTRIGRPPLKKAVDRKSHGRPSQHFQTASLDTTGEQVDDKEELMAAINAARTAANDASSGSFWKKMEPVFTQPTPDDLIFLKNQIAFAQELDKSADDILAAGYNEDKGVIESKSGVVGDDWFEEVMPLSQRLLSAFISPDELDISNARTITITSTENGNELHHYPFDKGGFCNGFGGVDGFLEGTNGHRQLNGTHLQSHQVSDLYECRFEEMSFDDRILLELHSIGIYPNSVPELDEGGDAEIDKAIFDLQNKLTEQVKEKKSHLQNLEKSIQDIKVVTDDRNLEQSAMDKLVERACKKLCSGGRGGASNKNSGSKVTKQVAQAFAKRTLARCHQFEQTGRSCFSSDPCLRDALLAPLPRSDSKAQPATDGGSERGRKPERGGPSSDVRGKKREVLLDEVSRGGASFSAPKWKKSDQQQPKDSSSTKNNSSSNPKGGGVRGERKNKAKPKQQKMAHLSAPPQNTQPASTKAGRQEAAVTGQTKDANDGLFAEMPLSLDDLDVAGGGEDLGSWLNVDDEALQDTDLVGLQIPMDDLADLTFT